MKDITLIRGIPGSGKSTFASMMNVDFKISTDDFFADYTKFDKSKLGIAHKWCQLEVETRMLLNESIAVANTFTQEWEMQPYFDLAEKYGYRVHTIIMENRHGSVNVHNVPIDTITKMVDRFEVKLCRDLYADLVKTKTYDNGLTIHKYSRKVFFGNLWNSHPDLIDARGIVYDQDGNLVQYPFTKIFNRFENGTDIPRDHIVTALEKINGFMAAVTLYNNEILVSTTGSLDSDYVKMAKEMLPLDKILPYLDEDTSYAYEIVHPNDPHIIEEEVGAYLIGGRKKVKGSPQLDVFHLKYLAGKMGVKFPEVRIRVFSHIVDDAKTSKREGWVCYDHDSDTVLKLKTPYYLTSKFIARTKDVAQIFGRNYKQKFDEEFYPLCEWLQSQYTVEQFKEIPEQDRLTIVRGYFNEIK